MPILRSNRIKLVFLAVALAVSFVAVLSAGDTVSAGGRCKGVSGDYERPDAGNWILYGDIAGGREVIEFTGLYTRGPKIQVYTLISTVHTANGELDATERVIVNTATGRSIDLVTITDGTGYWEGARGRVIVPNDGGATGRYFGYICVGDGD